MLGGGHLSMAEHEQLNQVPARDYDNSHAWALPVPSIQGAMFLPPTAGKATGILQLCKPLVWLKSHSIDLHQPIPSWKRSYILPRTYSVYCGLEDRMRQAACVS